MNKKKITIELTEKEIIDLEFLLHFGVCHAQDLVLLAPKGQLEDFKIKRVLSSIALAVKVMAALRPENPKAGHTLYDGLFSKMLKSKIKREGITLNFNLGDKNARR